MRLFVWSILIILLGLGGYFYFFIYRTLKFWTRRQHKKNTVLMLLSGGIMLAFVIFSTFFWSVGAMVEMHFTMICIVMDSLFCLIRKLRKNVPVRWWEIIYCSGIVQIAFAAIVITYGYWNMIQVVPNTYTVTTDKNIRDEGYRFVMLADLHYGTTMQAKKLQKYCDEISALKPDLLFLCGDITDENTSNDEMQEAFRILGGVTTRCGIYYIFGNHDKAVYFAEDNYSEAELRKSIQKNGIQILEDAIVPLEDGLTIIGRQDLLVPGSNGRMEMEELMASVDRQDFILVLQHEPRELKKNAAAGCDLQLSGHTHGGQIWPVSWYNELFAEQNHGRKVVDSMTSIVTTGIGGWGYPVKTVFQSEYLIIDLEKKK